ncbi:hypothetical protein A3Q56_06086 [Intoshia linei]|uniref:Uncharacterized protein n=1 Tax=Intoshia linei TaxID=1819745 RepID=A0A177AW34_9BILA|nr:hypothetical protein A3Q56_06086 [Intoshia linei]
MEKNVTNEFELKYGEYVESENENTDNYNPDIDVLKKYISPYRLQEYKQILRKKISNNHSVGNIKKWYNGLINIYLPKIVYNHTCPIYYKIFKSNKNKIISFKSYYCTESKCYKKFQIFAIKETNLLLIVSDKSCKCDSYNKTQLWEISKSEYTIEELVNHNGKCQQIRPTGHVNISKCIQSKYDKDENKTFAECGAFSLTKNFIKILMCYTILIII